MEVFDYRGGRLDEEKVNFFRAFGYLVFRGLLDRVEMAAIEAEFSRAMDEEHADRAFDPAAAAESERRAWALMLESWTPFHAGLLEDERFLTLAGQLLGADVIGIKVQANRFGGDTPWHRDTYTDLRGGIKFLCYHEAVRRDTGALRLIPLTHVLGDNYLFAEKLVRLPADAVPAVALETDPGDVVAFDMRAWHGTFGGAERHASDLSYYNNPRTADEEEALRLRARTNAKILLEKFGGQRPWFYSREWIENRGGSPVRARWIARLREVGYFDAEGIVEPEPAAARR
jgi:ectoine hydroxylase-related dioxygenase (phytanoyl-CoA dioxygenase family)